MSRAGMNILLPICGSVVGFRDVLPCATLPGGDGLEILWLWDSSLDGCGFWVGGGYGFG